jgi:Protein of unknown function (DUF4058)
MPSPFPGMDPYLEAPGLWPDVHHEIISVAREILNGQLRPRYHVRIEERVYISDDDDPGRSVIIPDLRIAERLEGQGPAFPPGGVATLEVAEPVEVTLFLDEEIREARLEVIDRQERQVVTVIEVLSPTNKIAGARGLDSYQQKRKEILASPSHLVEIDLLRAGDLPFAPWRVRHDYLVHVSRAGRRPRAAVWPIFLPQRLPVVPIPLRPDDPDAKLDLQAVLSTAYDRAAYDLEVDYRNDPVPPLPAPSADWAARLLRDKGLR